jgi:hypothetical protein
VDDDLWHVIVASGETKVLTLEQLDDLFRLDIIDADTKVWQPGMRDWLPLSVVAGLEEPPTVIKAPAPPPSRRPVPPRKPTPVLAAVPPAPARSPLPAAAPAVPLRSTVQTLSGRAVTLPFSGPAAAPGGTESVTLPWGASSPAPGSGQAVSALAMPESLRPIVLSDGPPPIAPPRPNRLGSVVVALAIVAGVGISLYRNDVLRDVARSTGQEGKYAQLEAAVGSPGFGTPRAVKELTAASLPLRPSSEATPAARIERSPTTLHASSSSRTESGTASPKPRETTATRQPEGSSRGLEAAFAAQLGGGAKASPSKAARRTATPAAPTRRSEPRSASAGLGIKGSSNTHDPLNGKL